MNYPKRKIKMKINKHHIQLFTCTPVGIGNEQGDELSPLTDFIIQEQRVIYIDQEKLARRVEEKKLMDRFVRGAGKLDNTRTRFDLQVFIKNELRTSISSLVKYTIPLNGKADRRTTIRPVLKTAGRPFVSGSSIKGAIKTAILYYWLTSKEQGRENLNKIVEYTEKEYNTHKIRIEKLEEKKHRTDVLTGKIKTSKDSLKKKLKKEKYRLQNEIKSEEKMLNKLLGHFNSHLDQSISSLFGDIGRDKDKIPDFSNLRISDTNTMSIDKLAVYETKRLHLLKGKLTIPVCLEMIKPGVMTNFHVSTFNRFHHPDLYFLNEENLKVLWDIINNFSAASVDHEWQMLDDHNDNSNINHADELNLYNDLLTFYESFHPEIGKDRNTAYLRLGFGKSFFDNSIGLAIYKASRETFMKYVKLFQLGKPHQKVFPVTRTICTVPFLPTGWVKMIIH